MCSVTKGQPMNYEPYYSIYGTNNAGTCVLPCPFCGNPVDVEDSDTLYPSGSGWKFNDELQLRTYHGFREVPPEQWCYVLSCSTHNGGCGAAMYGDSKAETIASWNKRINV